jgi:hypothetical protein
MIRPRLQLHLSTLLIVSLLAAGLVWLNISGFEDTAFVGSGNDNPSVAVKLQMRGWPIAYQTSLEVGAGLHIPSWAWPDILWDVVVCLTLLALAAAAIEWATRRMKRKPPP